MRSNQKDIMVETQAPRRRSKTNAMTIADVALAAGVSAQTASRALRGAPDVSEAARAKVEAAMREIGYVPNLAARNLASNKSMLVATILPLLSSSVFGETMEGAQEVLASAGYQTFIGYTKYDPQREEALVRSFLGRRPDGFLIVGTHHTAQSIHLLRQSGLPVVETWDWTDDPIDELVGFSNREAFVSLTKALADKGYRRPVFAGVVESGDARAVARRDGFIATASALWSGEAPRVVSLDQQPHTMAVGAEAFRRILQEHPQADVILFSSDIFASGAMLAAAQMGVSVPKDIAITGFGDYEIADRLTPRLTTVAVPARGLGRQSAEALLRRMRGAPRAEQSLDLGYEIVARESA